MGKTRERVEPAWSEPYLLDDVNLIPREPGVYRLLALRNSGKAPIPRFLATDSSGI